MNDANEKTDMSFEDALTALEGIVAKLERGEVSLDDAVAAYEEGSRLKVICQKRLDDARLKVEKVRAARGSAEAEGVSAFDGDNKK